MCRADKYQFAYRPSFLVICRHKCEAEHVECYVRNSLFIFIAITDVCMISRDFHMAKQVRARTYTRVTSQHSVVMQFYVSVDKDSY